MQRLFRTTLGTLAAAALLFVVVIPASAGGQTQVAGLGTPEPLDGACSQTPGAVPGAAFIMDMSGDLDGCWYTDPWTVDKFTPSGSYSEHGTETFVGCYKGACGTFRTEYFFRGKYAPDGSEIHGFCQHDIVSGTGVFAGATGRIRFNDDVSCGNAPYKGHVKFP